jgi:hypothetical protein
MGLYSKVGSGPWRVESGGEPAGCAEKSFFPAAVLAVWEISTAGESC